MKRLLALAVGVAAGMVVVAAPVAAHPLGNFTTNVSAGIDVAAERVVVSYVVDLAEIPALRVTQRTDPLGGSYASDECATLAGGLELAIDGRTLVLSVGAARASLPPGEAGLPTLRLECSLSAPYSPGRRQALTFRDTNFADRIGWREVTAAASGAHLVAADVPSESTSDVLRSYPAGRVLDERTASLTLRPGAGTGAPAGAALSDAPEGDRLTRAFTSLVAERDLTVPFAALAVVVALLLGAVHALAPGHGKTVMAAYLVGRDGDRRLAALLGLTVASTHTMAVLVLGTIVSASETVAPERAYPLLGAVSGLLFASVGVTLLVGALRARRARRLAFAAAVHELEHTHAPALVGAGGGHDDGHDQDHDHDHGHDHEHDHGHTHHFPEPEALGWRSIVAPGLAGGLVPSPSALLVYLAGLALGRAWFGVLLVVTYGFGIAASLVAAGYLLVRARARFRFTRAERVAVHLPLITAALVVGGGLWIAARSAGVV